MITDVTIQKSVDLTSYVPSAINDEAKRLLKLYWIIDSWLDDLESTELHTVHAQVLGSQFNHLVHYYLDGGQRNKAKLALTLRGASTYAEKMRLNEAQINAIQTLLVYFQRANLSVDDLKQCHQSLLDHDIYTLPEMPNWQAAIADH